MSRVSSCGHALRLWRSLAKSSTRLRSLMRRSTKSTSCFTCVTSRNFLQLKHVKQNCCSSAEDRSADAALACFFSVTLIHGPMQVEAVQVLVQGGWVYRAIKLLIRVFQWEKAFELARSQQTHIDTILYYRQKYLAMLGNHEESIPKLAQASQQMGPLNEQTIRAKIEVEKERERERGGARSASN
mmetsp:Transcript_14243/g.37686  ORF Transcript_14243/g.37686 Transcript_14243/m.37686 type:complete len:185 (-) Transcript_14243:358-912(-)